MTPAGSPRQGGGNPDTHTPPELLSAIKRKWGIRQFRVDLATTAANPVGAKSFFTPGEDALRHSWNIPGDLWLNPPWNRIAPFAAKCSTDRRPGTRIFFLVPAAVGSRWFREHVWGKARIYFLTDRIRLVGAKWVLPKDCMLCVFGEEPGVEFWGWKNDAPAR